MTLQLIMEILPNLLLYTVSFKIFIGGLYLFCFTKKNFLLLSFSASTILSASLKFVVIGFSHKTCLLLFNPLIDISACNPLGVQVLTTSISYFNISSKSSNALE